MVPERYQDVIVRPDFESPVPMPEKPIDAGWFYSRFPIDGNEEVQRRLRPGMVSVVPGATADIVLPMAQVAPQYRNSISAIEVRDAGGGTVLVLLSDCARDSEMTTMVMLTMMAMSMLLLMMKTSATAAVMATAVVMTRRVAVAAVAVALAIMVVMVVVFVIRSCDPVHDGRDGGGGDAATDDAG